MAKKATDRLQDAGEMVLAREAIPGLRTAAAPAHAPVGAPVAAAHAVDESGHGHAPGASASLPQQPIAPASSNDKTLFYVMVAVLTIAAIALLAVLGLVLSS